MSIWDDRILEYIREEESGSPKEIEDSGLVRVSRQHISRRLKKLSEHNLLQHLGNGVYVITEKGEGYLDEEYDVATDTWVGEENGNGADTVESSNPS